MLDNVTYKEIFPAVKITTRLTRLSLDKKSRSGRSHQIKLSLSLGKKKNLATRPKTSRRLGLWLRRYQPLLLARPSSHDC